MNNDFVNQPTKRITCLGPLDDEHTELRKCGSEESPPYFALAYELVHLLHYLEDPKRYFKVLSDEISHSDQIPEFWEFHKEIVAPSYMTRF